MAQQTGTEPSPVTQERQTVATGQCVEGEPDPGLD